MGNVTYAFMDNNDAVLAALSKNEKLKGSVYQLFTDTYWQMPEEGLLFLDIERYALPADRYHQYSRRSYIPITAEKLEITVNTVESINQLGCYVAYIPDSLLVQYLKQIAKQCQSKLGLIMQHERGDNLYDQWAWYIDGREDTEQFWALYEGNTSRWQHFELEGCPFQMVDRSTNGFNYPMTDLFSTFEIQDFPDIIEIAYTGHGFENKYQKALEPFVII